MRDSRLRNRDPFGSANPIFDGFPSDKTFKRVSGTVIAIWVAVSIAALATTGVVIWGIIQLVNHFTGA